LARPTARQTAAETGGEACEYGTGVPSAAKRLASSDPPTPAVTGPRVAPGTPEQIGRLNFALVRLVGAATGGTPPNVFTTLARHRALFRRWLRFAGGLMPGGVLPRADAELVILRVAHNCASGRQAGLSTREIDACRAGPDAQVFSSSQRLLVRAADELHSTRTLSDELWSAMHAERSEIELIELCMLIGHYEMLAMTLNALAVQPDQPRARRPSPVAHLLQSMIARRQRTTQRRTHEPIE
jgi:alkylhydroperoxidase family enzyme